MKFPNIEEAKRAWVDESETSDLGLWWIADDVRELMPGASEEEVCRETLRALLPLLRAGTLRAGDMLPTGRFSAWQAPIEEQLARIEAEWIQLGREPIIGEIVWFI